MPHSLFISDLHLCAEHAASQQAFQYFIEHIAPQADAVYILGDLFEYWAGDDDVDDPFHRDIVHLLASLQQHNTHLFIMHGNRDLLMGQALAQVCGATLLMDPTLLVLYGKATLLCHGDTLCTDDVDYQRFRAQVHQPEFQRQFLAQPLVERKKYIAQLRERSKTESQQKHSDIMDVNEQAVCELLRCYEYPRLIHGHTHRPNCHQHIVDGQACERWVLADWYQRGSALRCHAQGCEVITF